MKKILVLALLVVGCNNDELKIKALEQQNLQLQKRVDSLGYQLHESNIEVLFRMGQLKSCRIEMLKGDTIYLSQQMDSFAKKVNDYRKSNYPKNWYINE